jgi:hypothetical protein
MAANDERRADRWFGSCSVLVSGIPTAFQARLTLAMPMGEADSAMLVERGMNYRVSWMRLSSTELYGTVTGQRQRPTYRWRAGCDTRIQRRGEQLIRDENQMDESAEKIWWKSASQLGVAAKKEKLRWSPERPPCDWPATPLSIAASGLLVFPLRQPCRRNIT